MADHDYIRPGMKVKCVDKCKLKKAHDKYPNRCALTEGKEYKCTSVASNKQTFKVKDDAGMERSFKCYGDKYFAEAREPQGSFGSCGGFVNKCASAGLSHCAGGDACGTKPKSLFYCKIGPNKSVTIDCEAGSCHFSTGTMCETLFTTSSRYVALADMECNKTSPLCPQ
jgi:hypothetical protein